MFELLIWATLATAPATPPPQQGPVLAWLQKAIEPDVVVAILLPVLGAILLWVRRSTQNEAKLGREEFRDHLIAEISSIVNKEMGVLQSKLELKIEKVSIQIDYVSRQSEENDRNIRLIESEIESLKTIKLESYSSIQEGLNILESKTRELKIAVESSYRYDAEFLSRIDAELSAVLSSYLKCPVEIKLFRTHKDAD